MLGAIVLGVLILVEIVFMVLSLLKKSNFKKEKHITSIILFLTFLLLVISPIINWGFQWFMLGLVLGIQALLGILFFVRKRSSSEPRKIRLIFGSISKVLLIGITVLPVLIFPQYNDIKPTGEYPVGTKSYTLTDESREEYFTEEKDSRKITIQYWYPVDQSGRKESILRGKFPLVVFSHGSFGYRMSNYSTYQELASHGYIVCSIDHTYHAFMTKQEDGKTIIANMEFMNNAMKAENGEISDEETYKLTQEWLKLRIEDMTFVLDYIKKMTTSSNADAVYQSIDLEHIGLFGHSIGGATAAQIGREDEDVDAVIVVDGTMLGEIIGFENGQDIVTDIPYPKPIMNFYNESHYNVAIESQAVYANMVASRNALNSYQVVIKGSDHLSFTDLPIISPFLSKMLDTGAVDTSVDARYCIETTNEDILQFFDHYLKSSKVEIPKERFK
ncbi:MAG: platelet-activating factor acetylhydrolase, plasma/intracellular isoform [Clostridiales bacterium]|jgi:dienelactone hydrolase|nr:platelet-activating factor acetylhydrolase, plasma/intracellular isoform [Clostridiales bacterium]